MGNFLGDVSYSDASTVTPPSGGFASNTSTPSSGLTKLVNFMGNNLWVCNSEKDLDRINLIIDDFFF